MKFTDISQMYDFSDRSLVITGGTGGLGQTMVQALLECGANVAVLTRQPDKAKTLWEQKSSDSGRVLIVSGDVLDLESLKVAAEMVQAEFGRIDGLINGAGGNHAQATTQPDKKTFFDLPESALRYVFDLNLLGTMLSCQAFGPLMIQKGGVILNISSMAALQPLTRVVGYGAAKAGVDNFTRWLAVHMAQEFSAQIRVNAIAPGFFLTEQNRFLLLDPESNQLTPRGEQIIAHTPMARFGNPADLVGPMLWLLSPASAFVTGIVVPVDGGFSAYSGV